MRNQQQLLFQLEQCQLHEVIQTCTTLTKDNVKQARFTLHPVKSLSPNTPTLQYLHHLAQTMDRTYDVDAAAEALEEIASEWIDNPFSKLHLAEITNAENWAHLYEPEHVGIPKAWRLINQVAHMQNNARAPREEVVLTVQGIIAKKDLPPFEDKISPSSTHTQHLRQSITLIGFQTPTFLDIKTSKHVASSKQAQEAEELTFGHDVDPKDILKKAAGNRLVHIEDNVVQYYEMVKTKGSGDAKFLPAKPIKFKWSKFKSTMVLRSLTIMDGTFTQDAAKMQLQLQKSAIANISMGPTLKRSVGYADEEFGITKHKFSRLRVDEDEDDVNKANKEWD
ncbi:hypothetical protein CPB84DRAFT_1848068 [Gymnopilus junonius]|uniref:Uncharacterized protein n=1 Tax=Gymnopilus junonius TaxID=109634 RepID=A0A9P5TL66_GYMJU|nr:hypothetical protein CPB84DRAFT_1848068 [Gymnopilus junonius]